MQLRCATIEDAREAHPLVGGWVLREPDVSGLPYLLTTDQDLVLARRGQAFIDKCDELDVWDETAFADAVVQPTIHLGEFYGR